MPLTCRTAVVVLNWNRYDVTHRLLTGLLAQGLPAGQIVLVDNASPDGSGGRLQADFPSVGYVQTGENLGFAAGMNQGLSRAGAAGFEAFVLLNNDLEPGPGMLEAMEAAAAADPGVGVVGAVLHPGSLAGPVEHAGHSVSRWTAAFGDLPVPRPGSPPPEVGWVSGAALLLTRRALEEVGYLDEDFFMYWEEVEYCCRARALGLKVVLAPDAHGVHADTQGSPDAWFPLFLCWRNRWLFIRRALPWYCRPSAWVFACVEAARDIAFRLLRGVGGVWVPLLGTWDGLLGRTGSYRLDWVRARARR